MTFWIAWYTLHHHDRYQRITLLYSLTAFQQAPQRSGGRAYSSREEAWELKVYTPTLRVRNLFPQLLHVHPSESPRQLIKAQLIGHTTRVWVYRPGILNFQPDPQWFSCCWPRDHILRNAARDGVWNVFSDSVTTWPSLYLYLHFFFPFLFLSLHKICFYLEAVFKAQSWIKNIFLLLVQWKYPVLCAQSCPTLCNPYGL